ncbi:40459_t:CDS:2, partial [Gigaspora margarita]
KGHHKLVKKLSQIIQDIVIHMPEESFSYMPSNEAICKQISYARNKNMPTQPQILENINYLEEARYWLMDGTFKTVPTLFCQLYTIHAIVGGKSNSHVFSMVYVLMT